MELDWFTKAVLGIIGISSVLGALDATGLINYIPKLNRLSMEAKVRKTMILLKEFGIDPDENRRLVNSSKILSHDTNSVDGLISGCVISKKVSVGKTEAVDVDEYWDVMGDSTNDRKAVLYARMLSSKYKELLREGLISDFDFVVTPVNGSPILGYEFAKILKKKVALHRSDPKYYLNNGEQEWHQYFDMHPQPERGGKALIVDDSTTGGRMVIEAIDHARAFGYEVEHCLVVFEPQHKAPLPSKKLLDKKVKLHSIKVKG